MSSVAVNKGYTIAEDESGVTITAAKGYKIAGNGESTTIRIEREKPIKPMRYVPSSGYHYIAEDGDVRMAHAGVPERVGVLSDRAMMGNVFHSYDEAMRDAAHIRARRRLVQFALHLNPPEWNADWGDESQTKYTICYDGEEKGFHVGWELCTNSGQVVFHTWEAAGHTLQWMHEENLLEDYFGMPKEETCTR